MKLNTLVFNWPCMTNVSMLWIVKQKNYFLLMILDFSCRKYIKRKFKIAILKILNLMTLDKSIKHSFRIAVYVL